MQFIICYLRVGQILGNIGFVGGRLAFDKEEPLVHIGASTKYNLNSKWL